MKANEYINKYGVDCAKEILKHNQDLMNISFFIDLKRLVESHELVKKMGGLNGAINSLSLLECSLAIDLYHGVVGVNAEAQISELKQAIADVESCVEVTK